jgi:hypothetical protein
MAWEYGSVVAVQTGREVCPIRVLRVNGRLWRDGQVWDRDDNATSPDDMLNMLGAEDWELVSVIVALDGWDDGNEAEPPAHFGRTFIYYLKRPRS